MPEEELKTCPACSSVHVIHVEVEENGEIEGGAFMCQECGTHGPVKKKRQHAAHAWNSLPRHPTWTKARPTKPGFYFYRRKTWEPKIVHIKLLEIVHRKGVTDVLVYTETCMLQMSTLKGKWAGPIPEPLA